VKIVITGALGHIGSQLIREIPTTYPGAEIVMIDNLLTQRYCSLFNLPVNSSYRFLEADVLNIDLSTVVKGADVVLHFAAITDAASSFDNKEQVEYVNYNATVKVVQACKERKCPMIHISSTSVYGTQNEVVDENCSDEELQPQSPYAEAKLKEEKYLQALGNSENFKFVICRFGTICGISPGMRFHTAINKFCWQAVMGQPITVWSTALHQKRPYLTLDDAIRALKYIIENNQFDQRIYNIVTENMTVNSIVQIIRKYIPDLTIEFVDSKIMNQLSYEVSSLRFREKGFKFMGKIDRSIKETIDLFKGIYVM